MHNCHRQNVCLISDANRGITQILYNHLNRPSRIAMVKGSSTSTIDYVYSASGAKLRVIHRPNVMSPLSTTTDYVNGYIFINNSLSMALTENGYYTLSSTGDPTYHFYLKDHQGNNRVVVTQNDSIVQTNHYYPYGGVIGDISTNENVQKYKFEGKELDRTFGLDNYDIHARQYFAMMPSWDRIDPLAEKYYRISPYAYCGGDPVNLGDYDGKEIIYYDEKGQIEKVEDNNEYDQVVISMNGQQIEGNQYKHGTIKANKKRTCLIISGDKAGTDLFEFLADNSSNTIEWGQIKTGENSSGTNYVSSRKSEYNGKKEGPNKFILEDKDLLGTDKGIDPTTLREISHSHPDGSDPSKNDIEFSKHWDQESGKELNYNVYRPSYLDAGSERKAKYLPFTYRVDQLWVKILYNIEL